MSPWRTYDWKELGPQTPFEHFVQTFRKEGIESMNNSGNESTATKKCSHGWFHWLIRKVRCMAVCVADGSWLNDCGIECAAQFWWMTSKSSPPSQRLYWEMVGIRSRAYLDCTAALQEVPGLVEVVAAQHCECTKCHWIIHLQTLTFMWILSQ